MTAFHDDPLNDLFEAAGSNVVQLAPRREPPASYVAPTASVYRENCPKCSGSGQWRPGYACFKCAGSGKLKFKTSPEQRHASRTASATRRVNNREANIEAFKTEFPDVFAWMNGNAFTFAVSLLDAVAKFGGLTDNQMAAAVRCIDKQRERDTARAVQVEARAATVAAAPTLDASPIAAALDRALARTGSRPKLYIGNYRFQFAGAASRNAGSIYVTNKAKVYLGRITQGRFVASRDADEQVTYDLQQIAIDPRAAAIAHGFNTGNCACCGRLLTDPVSVANGIGPICATNFGW
jgi:hypothetical protein